MNLANDVFRDKHLSWNMFSEVCSDEALIRLGRNTGCGSLVKAHTPQFIFTYCVLHRYALETKKMPPKLAKLLKLLVECLNYVQNSAMNHRIFKEMRNKCL